MKNGIDYFPLDVALDDKFDLIEAEFGMNGFAVVVKLLQKIYGGNGYFCYWNHEVALLFTKKACFQLSTQQVCKIVNACLERGIFHQGLYESYGILTSSGIQKRYFEAASRRKSLEADSRFLLISIKKYAKSTEIIIVNEGKEKKNVDISAKNVDILSKNADRTKQRKGKKSKEEKSIGGGDAGPKNAAPVSCSAAAIQSPRAENAAPGSQKGADCGMDTSSVRGCNYDGGNSSGDADGICSAEDDCEEGGSCVNRGYAAEEDADGDAAHSSGSGLRENALEQGKASGSGRIKPASGKPCSGNSGQKSPNSGAGGEENSRDSSPAADPSSLGEPLKDCTFGEFNRVRLTHEEAQRLKDRLGPAAADEYINRLDSYIESTGREYKNHYAVILRWFREDQKKRQEPAGFPKNRGPVEKYDFKKLEDLAMQKLLRDSIEEDYDESN